MSEISKLDRNLIIKKIDNNTLNIQITDNEMLMSIVGQFDQNLKKIWLSLLAPILFLEATQLHVKAKKKILIFFVKQLNF